MPELALISLASPSELTSATSKILADTVRQFVNRPDCIDVTNQTNGRTVTLVLRVAPEDVGKVIGKQGRTARSLRVILKSISSKTGINFELDIHAEGT